MKSARVVVIGAGVGGLVAAIELARAGCDVRVLERQSVAGGKMREVSAGGAAIDSGPTVLTMRWVFDQIFADAGTSLEKEVSLTPLRILARHAWDDRGSLDLFADERETADAIGRFSGSGNARGYLGFCARARDIYRTLEAPFIRASQPTPISLTTRAGIKGLGDLWRISPFSTMWRALSEHFSDPRLRQLFGRYATYCGSSPFLSPATLMLVAHVEQAGVWAVEGGMQRLADALARVAAGAGVSFSYNSGAREIETSAGRVSAVVSEQGERIAADAVVVNADAAAVAAGLFGQAVQRTVPAVQRGARSLSAVTFSALAETSGFPLTRHNVFFSQNYEREFDEILKGGRLPSDPTVYICAEDRGDDASVAAGGERLLCLVNSPANGDTHRFQGREIEQCQERMLQRLVQCGLSLRLDPERTVVTTPADFEQRFPATGGALYGQASHGWTASFARPEARTKVPGLYLAGGSVHPGPGVPMAAISGWLAAASLVSDRASSRGSRTVVMPGGMSTR